MQGIPGKMEQLPEFVYIDSKETKGKTLILSTRHLIVAQVWMFRTQEEMDKFNINCRVTGVVQISCYRILLVFYRQIGQQNYKVLYDVLIPSVIPEMAKFYLKDRIRPHEPMYKKYLIE